MIIDAPLRSGKQATGRTVVGNLYDRKISFVAERVVDGVQVLTERERKRRGPGVPEEVVGHRGPYDDDVEGRRDRNGRGNERSARGVFPVPRKYSERRPFESSKKLCKNNESLGLVFRGRGLGNETHGGGRPEWYVGKRVSVNRPVGPESPRVRWFGQRGSWKRYCREGPSGRVTRGVPSVIGDEGTVDSLCKGLRERLHPKREVGTVRDRTRVNDGGTLASGER